MFQSVTFCGASGQAYKFQRVKPDGDAWTQIPGVVIFAASDGMGWRIIQVAAQSGRAEDLGAIWRWREAQRYGATAVFARRNRALSVCDAEALDLSAGLSPVCVHGSVGPVDAAASARADDPLPLAA